MSSAFLPLYNTRSSDTQPVAGFVGTALCLVGECVTVAIFDKTRDPTIAAVAVFFLFFHLVWYGDTPWNVLFRSNPPLTPSQFLLYN